LTTPALMLQGTGSDVGKSLLVAGLARAWSRRGLRVRPFKPQNMSNNAAVTADGGEIGRAQALQARACGVEAEADMNPVLLKPQSDVGAQVVVRGRVTGNAGGADLVLVEGAGSPAEVNLRPGDIANMGFAQAAGVPVVLVGDIDRGGVIASLVGTWSLLEPGERARLEGCIVNKFRGDPTLFEDGLAVIAERTGLQCFGVVPWFQGAARLPAEDGVALDSRSITNPGPTPGAIRVAVPRLPRIANFDDLDPLIAEPDVSVEVVEPGRALPGDADLVILPGSKSTIADLAVVRAEGWDVDIAAHLRRGGWLLGLCAGAQMLGQSVADPMGLEGPPGRVPGLGLLEIETEIGDDKTLARASGVETASGEAVRGYEMHMGRSTGAGLARPFLSLGGRAEGAVSADGRIMGSNLHGLFAADGFRHAFLDRIRARRASGLDFEASIEATLDALADHLEASLDLERLLEVARGR
jgi:adenosylcobyric acid synthase